MVSVLLSSYNVEFEHTTWSLFTQCFYTVWRQAPTFIYLDAQRDILMLTQPCAAGLDDGGESRQALERMDEEVVCEDLMRHGVDLWYRMLMRID